MTKVTQEVVVPSNEPDDFGFTGLWNESDFAPGPVEEIWELVKGEYTRHYTLVIKEQFDREWEKLELRLLKECQNVTRVDTVAWYRLQALDLVDEHVKLSYNAYRDVWKNQGRAETAPFFTAFILCCLGSIFSEVVDSSQLHRSNLTELFRSGEGNTWWRDGLTALEHKWEVLVGEDGRKAGKPPSAAIPHVQSLDAESTIAAATDADPPAVDALSLPPNMTAAEKDQYALRVADETGFSLNEAAKIIAGHLREPKATSRRRITRARRARRKQNGQLG